MKNETLNARMKLAGSATSTLEIPNFATERFYVPVKVIIENESESDDSGLSLECIIQYDGTTISRTSEAYFKFSNTIDLEPYKNQVNNCEMSLKLRNMTREPETFSITIEYAYYTGTLIYENTFNDKFDEILADVHKYGRCTRLTMKTSHPIENATIVPNFYRVENENENEDAKAEEGGGELEWLEALEIGDTDEDNCYDIDLSDEDLELSARKLNFMKLQLPGVSEIDDFKIFILAFGFKKN